MAPSRLNRRVENARLQVLAELLLERFDDLQDALGISLQTSRRAFYGACPVHRGDNSQALTLYRGGDVPGKWLCFTRHCEETFHKTLLGFVRGVLSSQRGWSPGEPPSVPFAEAVRFGWNFVGIAPQDIEIDMRALEREDFLRGLWAPPVVHEVCGSLSRSQVRALLTFPAHFFLERGYSPETLDHFDVGLCTRPGRPFFGRAVVPVYQKGRAVGFTARSTFPRCLECSFYHQPGPCPGEVEGRRLWTKWRHSEGFRRESVLYNWDVAGPLARSSGKLLLVEGPGCLWRAVEAGCPATAAVFGSRLTEPQQVLVESTGLRDVYVAFDNDEAGDAGFRQVKEALRRVCRVHRLSPPANDLGASSIGTIQPLLKEAGLL